MTLIFYLSTLEDDVDVEDWVACETCSGWIHSKCIPPDHPYSITDADFYRLHKWYKLSGRG